jgi:hypothetical protein
MSFWRRWVTDRSLAARASEFLATIVAEPDEADVRWLAEQGTSGDVDHARWELRYARRALGLHTARRDALDDQTASAVARALSEYLTRDPAVAAGKLRVVERQLNDRLRGYGEALGNREGAGAAWHLGRTLLEFAGRRDAPPTEVVLHASELLGGYLGAANEALRNSFGVASLPEESAPGVREK